MQDPMATVATRNVNLDSTASSAFYVGPWCFDDNLRGMRGADYEVISAYGDKHQGYYVEWQYDKKNGVYKLFLTEYNDFIFLQYAKLIQVVHTYEQLINYCLLTSG